MCTFSLVFSLARRPRPYTVCVYLPDTCDIGFIISQLCLCLQTHTQLRKQCCAMPSPKEQMNPLIALEKGGNSSHIDSSTTYGCEGWAIFGLGVCAWVPHSKPNLVSHHVSWGGGGTQGKYLLRVWFSLSCSYAENSWNCSILD